MHAAAGQSGHVLTLTLKRGTRQPTTDRSVVAMFVMPRGWLSVSTFAALVALAVGRIVVFNWTNRLTPDTFALQQPLLKQPLLQQPTDDGRVPKDSPIGTVQKSKTCKLLEDHESGQWAHHRPNLTMMSDEELKGMYYPEEIEWLRGRNWPSSWGGAS